MLYLSTKSHLVFPIKNPLSSSSKTHTTLAREPRNDFTRGQNLCWPHLGLHDTRGYTCENLSFTEVKPQVTKNHEFVTKSGRKKQHQEVKKTHTKKTCFFTAYLASEPPKNLSFIEAKPQVAKNNLKKRVLRGLRFQLSFKTKNQIFHVHLRSLKARKPLFY